MSFESATDPANDGRYTGTVVFTHGDVGSLPTAAIFITNTGTILLPIPPTDFMLIFDNVRTETLSGRVGSSWQSAVSPGGTARNVIASGGAKMIRWNIAGRLGTVTVPFTEPSGPPIFPGPVSC